MPHPLVCIQRGGAVQLGSAIVCDGFIEGCRFRVQTHIHDDHMGNFEKSKGLQDYLLTPETFELLVADLNAEIECRDNFYRIPCGKEFPLCDGNLKLIFQKSNHMLGSCQVAVEHSDGSRIGYSSDFGWPLDNIIEVDILALDSTYGSPKSVRKYTQTDAEEELVNIVCRRLRYGPVHIYAWRGTIERALTVLGNPRGVPILATKRRIREIEVYQRHGLANATLTDIESEQAQKIIKEQTYIRLYAKGDSHPTDKHDGTSVRCTAFMNRDQPCCKISDSSYNVGLSNHADFNETLEYIAATKAKTVITDKTQNHGCELAEAINARLPGVCAMPFSNIR